MWSGVDYNRYVQKERESPAHGDRPQASAWGIQGAAQLVPLPLSGASHHPHHVPTYPSLTQPTSSKAPTTASNPPDSPSPPPSYSPPPTSPSPPSPPGTPTQPYTSTKKSTSPSSSTPKWIRPSSPSQCATADSTSTTATR